MLQVNLQQRVQAEQQFHRGQTVWLKGRHRGGWVVKWLSVRPRRILPPLSEFPLLDSFQAAIMLSILCILSLATYRNRDHL